MLTKLLHYEFKSTGRVVLPIAAGVLVLNIFTNILSHFVQNTSDRLPLAGVAMALLALASAVSLLVVLAICFFIEIQQFYRLLGERGYLMLALPVPIWQHIAAKVICGTVWTLFGMVFFTLCGMLTTDTVSGSGGTRLSGGQAQRLALARTLAHPRPVLILDDPFSALDRHTEDTVFADLQSDAKDKVVFLISHRLYHFPQMQKVIFMDGGKTTVGTHAQLMETVPLYRQLYESQTVQKEGDLDEE